MSQSESAKVQSVKVETTEVSPAVQSLSVEVEASRVDARFERSYRELARSVSVKGFRKGKVPRSIIEKMYAGAIAEEIERELISETFVEAVELADVMPLSEPDIEAATPEPGTAFRYTARVEVRPPIELPELSSVKGQRVAVEVTEEEVTGQLDSMREQQARLVEEDEGAEAAMGHTLKVDFVGRVDGEVFEGGSGQDMEIELGSGRLVPGFEEQLVGARAEDDVEVKVTFPEDYGAENLKGQDAVFQVHVASVNRREIPELDDEFAKDLGDFDTLDELREKIRENMTAQRLESSGEGARKSVLDSLIELTDFEVPPGVVERQLHSQVSSMQRQFQGQVPEEVLRKQLSRMHEEGRPNAERRVREGFLLAQIAEEQNIEIGEDDVENRLEEMAERQGMEAAQLRQMAEAQGWRESIGAELKEQRAVDFLVAAATVEEIEEPDASQSTDESAG